jgi:hypothetical protein
MKMNVKRERGKEAKTKRNVVESFEAEKRSRANLKGKRTDYNDKKRRDHYTNDSLNDSYE